MEEESVMVLVRRAMLFVILGGFMELINLISAGGDSSCLFSFGLRMISEVLQLHLVGGRVTDS